VRGLVDRRKRGVSGREGECGGVELRQVEIEVDCADVADHHRRQVGALAGAVSAGEIDAEVIAEHEADDGTV
jgi:hypothetical protein